MTLYQGEQTICTAKGRTYAFTECVLLEKNTGYRYCVGDSHTVDSAIRAALFGKHSPRYDFEHGHGMARFFKTKGAAKKAYVGICA